MSDSATVDISGVTPAVDADPSVAAPAPAAAPAEVAKEVAVEVVKEVVPATTEAIVTTNIKNDLMEVVAGIIKDLSGASVSGVGDLLRFVPRLAAAADKIDVTKAEKRALVIAAGHKLVEALLPVDAREDANRLVDAVFPGALAGVIDMARGRVTFQDAAKAVAESAAPVVLEVAQKKCLPMVLSWLTSCTKK